MFEKAYHLICDYDHIVIHRHTRPDGDALGCQMGLYYLIRENFPEKQVAVVGDDPRMYQFISGPMMDVEDSFYENALAVILDCGGESLVSDDRYKLAACTLRIDHHLYSGRFTDEEIIDSGYESCCGMIAEFAWEQNLKLSPDAAKALYTGIVTDSGRFRYDNTTARTFSLSAMLMEKGFSISDIYRELYAESFESKRRRAEFLLRVKFTSHNVAYVYTTKEQLAQMNMDVFAVSRGMVNTMADIQGVDIWVNFTEADNGVLCELRSSRRSVNPIAVKYGGGGHAKASGATLPDRQAAMAMLKDLDDMMEMDA